MKATNLDGFLQLYSCTQNFAKANYSFQLWQSYMKIADGTSPVYTSGHVHK